MQDTPSPHGLLDGVIRFLRDTAIPSLGDRAAYDARLAASLLATVQRELALGPPADAAELARLQHLLADDSSELQALNRLLCERIADGTLAWDDARLLEHLWATTLDKVAVDQPTYSTYVRVRATR